jgi:hypothetical protein
VILLRAEEERKKERTRNFQAKVRYSTLGGVGNHKIEKGIVCDKIEFLNKFLHESNFEFFWAIFSRIFQNRLGKFSFSIK